MYTKFPSKIDIWCCILEFWSDFYILRFYEKEEEDVAVKGVDQVLLLRFTKKKEADASRIKGTDDIFPFT